MEATASRPRIEIAIRPYTEADLPFIFSVWLRSFKHCGIPVRRQTRHAYFALHHLVIERFLARGGKVLIAHLEKDPAIYLGLLAYEETQGRPNGLKVPRHVLQYLYTKLDFRGFGVATALVKEAGIDLGHCAFTHETQDSHRWWRKHPGAELWVHLM